MEEWGEMRRGGVEMRTRLVDEGRRRKGRNGGKVRRGRKGRKSETEKEKDV